VTHAAWIPVRVNGHVDGLLTIAGRGQPIPDELLARGVELAQIVELALANALSMQAQKRLSRTDPVTGLANRRGFELALRRRPHESSFTILAMDLDGLKAVNDSYGHAIGDELLVLVSRALQAVVRDDDVLARVGGDEFAAILFGASPGEAEFVANRMLNALGQVQLGEVAPRISIGIAVARSDEDPDIVGLNADRAMYRAKRLGGMRYEFAGT
jgi:diguanylate cyclase (GGDEF)-like protein